MSKTDFIGIDLTSSPQKGSACVGLDRELNLIFAGILSATGDLVAIVASEQPCLTAIDAPLTLPEGLCCLEEKCDCQPGRGKGRECERQLAKSGIPCYFTTKRSIIRKIATRGIALKNALDNRGFQAIEVYPYATKVRLWGKSIPSKTTPHGLASLRDKLARLMPSLEPYIADFSHDLCDAAIAAYTAYLHECEQTEWLGSLQEGQICIPR
ncbi:MAG: DUF429 domain-containing protein [Chloroflexi bacterium]|nr:DUF429 domain-containing protein [Chloroflexota bacterium]